MKPLHFLLTGSFLLAAAPLATAEVTGRVNILWAQPQQLQLVPAIKLYPGTSMDIVLSGQVDVDHQFGERRRCKYFGIKCWYEQWDKPHWVGPDGIELQLAVDGAGVTRNGKVYQFNLPLKGGDANYNAGVNLYGMLWLNGTVAPASRAPCIGRPARCSGGDMTISFVNINVKPRLDALASRLETVTIDALDVAFIRSEDNIDALLYNPAFASDETITRLVSLLTQAAERLRGTIGSASPGNARALHLKIIDLASYADSLARKSPADAAKLRILIAESHFDSGNFSGATQEAPKMMDAAKKAFDSDSGNVENAKLYARAFKVNASAWREKKARNSSADIRVAIALLDQAVEVLLPFTAQDAVSKLISDINVDGARMLNVLRTDAELKAAEEKLVASVCFQLHAEQGKGSQFKDWKTTVKDPSLNCQNVRDTKNTPTGAPAPF